MPLLRGFRPPTGRVVATLVVAALSIMPAMLTLAAAPDPDAPAVEATEADAEPGDGTAALGDGLGDGAAPEAVATDTSAQPRPDSNDVRADKRGRRASIGAGDRWDVETGRVVDPGADPLDGDASSDAEPIGNNGHRRNPSAREDPSPSRIWPMRPETFTFTQRFGCVPQLGGFYEVVAGCPDDQPAVHSGIDLAAPTGTRIYAAADGWVTEAGLDRPSGLANSRIVIQHEDRNEDYATEYLHWSTSYVRAGDRVRAGDAIAEVGSVGYSTGPHLHFSVVDFRADERIDPVRWLPDGEAPEGYRGLEPNRRPLKVRAQNKPVPDYADPSPAPVPDREALPKADGYGVDGDPSGRGKGGKSPDTNKDAGNAKNRDGRKARDDGARDNGGGRERRGDRRATNDPSHDRGQRRGDTSGNREERGVGDRASDSAASAGDAPSDSGPRGRSRSGEGDRRDRDQNPGEGRQSDRKKSSGSARQDGNDEGSGRNPDRPPSEGAPDADAEGVGTAADQERTRREGVRADEREVLLPPPVPAVPPVPPPLPPPSLAAADAPPPEVGPTGRQQSADAERSKRHRGGG